jgi:NAD(P)-dependent dehydrogenase (short-subunit alcohol dehydrogenase family)
VHFAREGADVAIVYLDEHKDADETVALVEKEGRKCLKFAGDVGKPEVGVQLAAA